jgi:hypothetical protein
LLILEDLSEVHGVIGKVLVASAEKASEKDVPKLERTNLELDCVPAPLAIKHQVLVGGLGVPAVHCGKASKQGLTAKLADEGTSQSMAELDARLFPTCIDLPDVFVARADHHGHVTGA